ncbi:type IV toxin-antitoxin system AbiEi family antitoxin domain-containing protein [Rhodococcus maanshanensis]|uniref:Very-short-patch-repair endonuclease n=1 Tax=Rhodococcus maanshanensis TaxID=183556 RepID=A0A1H7VV47_9NOCA|nr:type IV toxin-antitoxin system AbiEi family antitoxin domain-containing protein [Rhodococcus maanshanensis]SEM12677.1 Very-short-patch-repair endonuclease [Rhodococcus maanshanensis]
MTPIAVHAVMANQDGVITLGQARSAGMSTTAVDRRVSTGQWRRLYRGVYLRSDRQLTRAARLRASVFAAGPDAVASGTSAAWWLGLTDRPPADDLVTIPRARAVKNRDRIRIRRRDLHWSDIGTVRGLRITELPLTVLEAAVELRDGSALMDRALQRHTTLAILEAVHERNSGRFGTAAATRLLRSAGEGGASEAERMLLRLLRGSELTGWSTHVTSCGYEIDVAFVRSRVAIEVDGWAWHRDVARFNNDARRQNILVNAGWHVLRFTWHQLRHDPDSVLQQIVSALGSRS